MGSASFPEHWMSFYNKNDGLTHVIRQISYHPDYLKEFLRTESFLLKGDGPLPFHYRHYIAIMAAARHHCTCLINHHKQKFAALGGNLQWLQGLQYCPKKLRNLNEINQILAHTPWNLRKCHIEKLNKGSNSWSIGELCQAVVILAHIHCLCSFVYASEILRQTDDCTDCEDLNEDDSNSEEEALGTVEELMEKMSIIVQKKEKESSHEEKRDIPCAAESASDSDMERFIDDQHSSHKDCSNFSENDGVFHIQDCTWEDHAYSLLNRYYNEFGTILDEKFKVAYDLTYYTMGHKKNVDTTIFRRAVWNYIHKIYGISHDDYNYEEMDDLLEKGFKSYIETVCFYPHKITKDAHDEIMRAFRHSEKVHVNLMVFEARMQAELLYSLSAIAQYMT
ncbi:sestrin homolog isoform X2 [Stegodyphus dumicola]|uniref:sestrin homolog isoform X2 n=1 Tax=Stegodyphus dumicola TaxID=202533 RepID=UPI0015AD963D|nr:sestrin homolog isoform X2 [Stegodyphus dumicola]